MKKSRIIAIYLSLCLVYYSCEESSDDTPDISNTLTDEVLSTARTAYQNPQTIFTLGNQSLNSAVAMLEQAARFTNTLTTTGTLQETANGFLYTPSPNDKMVYINKNGQTVASFIYTKINGTINGSAQDFMSNSHEFEFLVDAPGQGNMEISSITNGQLRSVTMKGTLTHNNQNYKVDLLVQGTYSFNVDNTGSELNIDAQYSGTIEGQNFVEVVDENWIYNSVYATGSGGIFAENVFRSFDTSWRVGEDRFQYQNGVLQSVLRDGRPSEWDVNNSPWKAEGTLLYNGKSIGNLTMGSEGNAIKVWLQLTDRKEELTSWRF